MEDVTDLSATRTSRRWQHQAASRTGNWDAARMRAIFPGDGPFGMPMLPRCGMIPERLAAYSDRHDCDRAAAEGGAAVHMFIDDYRFEPLWSQPYRMRGLDSAMSPLASATQLTREVDASAFGGIGDLTSLIGRTITDRAYMSTSRSAHYSSGGAVTMHITAPRGTRAVDAARHSAMPGQQEVILARGTRLRITGARRRPSGSWDVWGRVT